MGVKILNITLAGVVRSQHLQELSIDAGCGIISAVSNTRSKPALIGDPATFT